MIFLSNNFVTTFKASSFTIVARSVVAHTICLRRNQQRHLVIIISNYNQKLNSVDTHFVQLISCNNNRNIFKGYLDAITSVLIVLLHLKVSFNAAKSHSRSDASATVLRISVMSRVRVLEIKDSYSQRRKYINFRLHLP